MSFRWALHDAAGRETGSSEEFESRQAAEDWMGAEWRRLLEAGVLSATLYEGDRRLYRMRLTEG